MSTKILCVDDDQRLLAGIERQLGEDYEIETAESPEIALKLIVERGPFAVVISDMQMPEMNGVQLLQQVREISPDTVRIMLTGFADLKTTMDAVNQGNIYRFLSKPCENEILVHAIEDGLKQYRLLTAEKELVDGTLRGCVNVLSEVLSLTSPYAFGRASRIRRIACQVAQSIGEVNTWQIEIAALLSQLGCVTVPNETLENVFHGRPLSENDFKQFEAHPQVAHDLIQNIPRMEDVAKSVLLQMKSFDGSGFPHDVDTAGNSIPVGARILKLVSDFDRKEQFLGDASKAVFQLKSQRNHYDPELLQALESIIANAAGAVPEEISISDLVAGMVFAKDVVSTQGTVMVTRGHEVTDSLITRLKNLRNMIREPLTVTWLRTHESEQPQVEESLS